MSSAQRGKLNVVQIGYVSDLDYLREIIIFGVQNCLFHEMIICNNTERGSLKLTRCPCQKKCMKQKICQQRKAEIQSKTYV